MFKFGKYDMYLLIVILEEVGDCLEPKRSELRKFLEQINYSVIDITDELESVAQRIIRK